MRFLTDHRLILVLLGLAWLELSILPFFSVGGIKPDFFFVFLAFYAFRINWKHVVKLALVLGLVRDSLTNTFFGLETASCVAGALLLQFLALRLDRDKPWIQMGSLFCFSWTSLLVFSILALFVQAPYGMSETTPLRIFFVSVYTTMTGILLFPVFERWLKPSLRAKQYELF